MKKCTIGLLLLSLMLWNCAAPAYADEGVQIGNYYLPASEIEFTTESFPMTGKDQPVGSTYGNTQSTRTNWGTSYAYSTEQLYLFFYRFRIGGRKCLSGKKNHPGLLLVGSCWKNH
ncbi:hypothetical protein KIH79_08930 [Bifidobacterium sp. 82T10]|uniref:Uncharacterized protein n=1 Tax=Bifidobacterium miconis TaxID=2834435 RepID=A0ABS6WGP1_9BIFI|nr:hypothetical protein [Bifidobacterium miconis]MBW3093042.1 hypothetical protein [Bifidobacterium miconis]